MLPPIQEGLPLSATPKAIDFQTEESKTEQVAATFWSNYNPFPSLYLGVKHYAAKAIVPCWQALTGYNLEQLQSGLYRDHEELSWSMGSTAPVTLINIFSAKMVKGIYERAKASRSYAFSEEELNSLTIIINSTLTKIVLNLIKNSLYSSNPATRVFKTFANLAQKHFPSIAEQLPRIREINDSREQERLLKDLLAPLSVDFFKLAFPNGKQDLPLPYPVQDIAWEVLKKLFHQNVDTPQGKVEYVKAYASKKIAPEIIPENFVFTIYDMLMQPLLKDGSRELLSMEGGEFWLQISRFIGIKTAENVPLLLVQKRHLLADEAIDLLEVDRLDRQTVREMLTTLISDLGEPDDHLTPVWHFLSRYLVSTINHRFIELNKTQFEEAKHVFIYVKTLVRPAIAEIETDPSPENRRHRLISLFQPLSDRLIALSGLDKKDKLRLPFFKDQVVNLASLTRRKILPEFLANFYDDVTNPQRTFPELDRRLKVLLFDENFAINHLSSEERARSLSALYHRIGDPQNELWNKSGIAELSLQIENGYRLISHGIRETIKNYLISDSRNAAQLLIDFLPKKRLEPSEHRWLSLLIQQAVQSGDPFVEQTLNDIGIVIERALLHVFVYVGERAPKVIVPAEGEHAQKYLIANITIRLLDVIHKRPNITIQVEQCQRIENPLERQQRLRQVFEPLAREFLQVAIENPLNDLPMLSQIKEDLWESIQTKIVPDLLEKVYRRLNFWQARAASSKQLLQAVYGTTHPEEASKVIAHFGSEYIPYYLTFAHHDVALKLKQQAEEWFQGSPEISHYLHGQEEALVKLLGSNIHQYGESLNPAVQANKPFTTKLLDGVILKLMAKLSHKIHTTETNKPNFMVESFKDLLEVTANHFSSINEVTHQNHLKHAWNVTYEQMIAGFGPNLHKGIPQPHLSKEEQNRHRLEHFYKPVARRLFKLLDLEHDPEFALFLDAEPMKKVWGIVQDQLFPTILQSVFEKLMEPHTIRTLLLNSLENLNSALNAIPAEEPLVDDIPDQPELNEACGELVLQLLRLVPRTLAHSVFEIDRVQKITAQTIGSAISKTLRQWTWIKIMDKGIHSGIPSFRIGRWEGALNEERFVPLDVIVRPDGREVLEPGLISFTFPKTQEGKAAVEAKRQLDERSTELRLKHTMAVMTRRQIQRTLENQIKKCWDMIQTFLDEKTQLYFGLVGLKAKEGLDLVFGTLVFELLGPMLQFVLTPINMAFWYLMDEYLAARADDLSKDAIHRIQENLFFGLMDTFLDSFEGEVAAPVAAAG